MPGATSNQYYTQRTTTTTTTHTKRGPSYESDRQIEPPVPAVRTKAVTVKEMNKILDDVKAAESKNVVIDTLAALVTDCNATAEYLRSRSSSRQNLNEIGDEDTSFIYHVNQSDNLRSYTPPRTTETKRQTTTVRSVTSPNEPPVIVEYKLKLHSPYQSHGGERDSLRRRPDEERRTPSLERMYNEFGLDTPRDRSVSRTRSETPGSRRMIVLEEPKDRDAPICAYCDQAIYGPILTALAPNARKAQKYHPPHFICSFCTKPLNLKGTYREHDRKPYCHDCFYRLFSGHVYEVDSNRASSRV